MRSEVELSRLEHELASRLERLCFFLQFSESETEAKIRNNAVCVRLVLLYYRVMTHFRIGRL